MEDDRRLTIRMDNDTAQKLEEIKKYYGSSSDAAAIRKAIDDAHRVMEMRKEKDKEIFN